MTLYTQWITLGIMIGSGWTMGVILDLYRVLKARFRLRGWVVSLVDLLYWAVAAVLVFSLLMWSNWGELRVYVFIAVFAGLAVYHTWCSPWMIRVIRWLVRTVEETLGFLLRTLYTMFILPVILLWGLIQQLFHLMVAILRWILRLFLRLLSPVTRRLSTWIHPLIAKLRVAVAPLFGFFHRICSFFSRRKNKR